MKNKKLFLVVSLLIAISVVTIIGGLTLWHYKENKTDIAIIIGVYFGILSTLFSVFQMINDKKKEAESTNNGRKRYKSGYFIVPICIFSIIYILIALLYKWDNTMLCLGIGVCVISLIWTFILGILSKQSLSGQEDFIVQPEKFWRIIWNMLPARWGYENNPILNVLIIYSKEGEEQAKQMLEKYKQAENELRIDCHLCEVNKRGQLDNKLNTTKYIGIHLIYTEDIKNDMLWVRELLFEWANKNKSKPIVYTNYTTEDRPLNYGTSSKESDGIMRLFQRTHTLSELWREQSNLQYIFLKCFSFSFIIILIGLVTLFLNRMNNDVQNSGEQKQIVLVGGGTVKNYIENKKLSNDNNNLIFIPIPSNIACGRLGDEGFVNQLQGKIIIMSSERQRNESVFKLGSKSPIKHILEIYLHKDSFYIWSDSSVKWTKSDIVSGITLQRLIDIIKGNEVQKVFHTNEGSGTYNFYKDAIEVAKKSGKSGIYYSDKDNTTNFTGEKDKYLILTRSLYDPIPPKNDEGRIKIKMQEDVDGLFLYIPIIDNRKKENSPEYEVPYNIQNFLKSIGIKEFPKKIKVNQYKNKIIPDTSFEK